MQFEYKIRFEAENKEQSITKMNAISQILRFLSADDLEFIAKTSKEKPNWVKKAKPYTNFL